MVKLKRIQRTTVSHYLDKEIDRRITELVNRGEFRSKSDVVETALREFFAQREAA